MDVIDDDVLRLILERIDSPVYLVRAASTCKRWHGLIADAGFLRRYRSAHAPSLVAGYYSNGIYYETDSEAEPPCRGTLLLMYRMGSHQSFDGVFPDCVVCEPATRRYRRIPRPPNLVDGEASMAGPRIGMSSFRVLYMFENGLGLDSWSAGTAMFTAGSSEPPSWGSWTPRLAIGSPDDAINQDLADMRDLGCAGGSQYFYVRGHRNQLVALDRSSGEFSVAVFPPPSENQGGSDDFDVDLIMWRAFFHATDGRDGEPRIFTVIGETMKVYAKLDGGEWALEKRLSLREATRGLPGPLGVVTRGPGYVTLSPGTRETTRVWLISVDLETMQVALAEAAAADMGEVMYRCEIVPWLPVLNSV
ncbi:hypothetical protein PVAP13_3NG321900 [Panicum virgatum]|uniref:F-box domain-containing protein n=1 Tax=Panicum virgatum TaxID=38727 RepID=A0A8T0ULK2_PANVG|nr:hypothetical protein PVAP13_3NG321900 [Panicum virgatum]